MVKKCKLKLFSVVYVIKTTTAVLKDKLVYIEKHPTVM